MAESGSPPPLAHFHKPSGSTPDLTTQSRKCEFLITVGETTCLASSFTVASLFPFSEKEVQVLSLSEYTATAGSGALESTTAYSAFEWWKLLSNLPLMSEYKLATPSSPAVANMSILSQIATLMTGAVWSWTCRWLSHLWPCVLRMFQTITSPSLAPVITNLSLLSTAIAVTVDRCAKYITDCYESCTGVTMIFPSQKPPRAIYLPWFSTQIS